MDQRCSDMDQRCSAMDRRCFAVGQRCSAELVLERSVPAETFFGLWISVALLWISVALLWISVALLWISVALLWISVALLWISVALLSCCLKGWFLLRHFSGYGPALLCYGSALLC